MLIVVRSLLFLLLPNENEPVSMFYIFILESWWCLKSNLKSFDNGNCKSVKVLIRSMFHLVSEEYRSIQYLDFAIILVKLLVKWSSNAFYLKFRGNMMKSDF